METDNPAQQYCNIRCKKNANILEAEEQADAELAAKIKAARYARGMTQAEVAERAGVARAYIDMIERGVVPGTEDLRQQILTILELDPDDPVSAPKRCCGWCGVDISDRDPTADYCCDAHGKRARRAVLRAAQQDRHCVECGATIDPAAHLNRTTCSAVCYRRRENRLQHERKLNGYDHAHATDPSAPDPRPERCRRCRRRSCRSRSSWRWSGSSSPG